MAGSMGEYHFLHTVPVAACRSPDLTDSDPLKPGIPLLAQLDGQYDGRYRP